MNLPYEWAIQTKRPGDTRDYRILGQTQGEISEKDFDKICRSLSIGELPGGSDPHNPPAPWLAFGFFSGAQTHYLACVLQDWTDQQDARNRQISYASCLCVPFEQIAEAQLALAQIARLHSGLNLPEALRQIAGAAGDAPLELSRVELVPEKAPPLEAIAAQIDAIGFETCASIAATFLQEPVVLVGGKPGWEESLSNLEAVLSLLPYGARANGSVSSWTRTAIIHSIRLSFSSGGSRDKEYIAWQPQGSAARPALPEKMHLAYFNLLLEARKRHTTLEIIQHLSGSTTPLTFEAAEPFITTLQFLDRPYLIMQSIRAAQNTPYAALQTDIRDLLESDQAHQLGQPDRQKMLRYLMTVCSDPQNIAVLAKNWKPELWNDLVLRAVQDFSQENLVGLLYSMEVARGIKRLDEFFEIFFKTEILANKRSRGVLIQLGQKALKAAPDLNKDALFTLLVVTPLPPEFGLEWAQILFKDNLADEKDRTIFARLCAAPHSHFAHRSLRIALGLLDETLDLEALNEITRSDIENGVWLFGTATRYKGLKNVTKAFSQWTLRNAFRPSALEFQNAWEATFKRLESNNQALDSVSCANFEVVWLNFSGNRQPMWLPAALHAQTPREAFERYSATFAVAAAISGINQANVALNLDLYLNQYLLRNLAAVEIQRVDLFIEDVNKTLNDERLYMTQQKNKLREYLDARRSLKEIAACCVSILNDKRIKDPAGFIIGQLIETNFIFPARGVDELLAQIEAQSPEHAAEFQYKLVPNILSGNFGPQLAATYRQRWAETILQNINQLSEDISFLNPKDPAYASVSAELEKKLGKYLPKKGGLFGR